MGKLKTIHDYYDKMYELFPTIREQDIRKILNYGWKQVYLLNSYGGDLEISNNTFWLFFGRMSKDSLCHFQRYVKKLCLKFRILYKRRRIQWDGYYYFALTDRQQEELEKSIKRKGRPRKWKCYGNQILFKILDECKVREYNRRYIYKVPLLTDIGFTVYKPNYITDKAELIEVREGKDFKNVMVYYNNFKLLNGSRNNN